MKRLRRRHGRAHGHEVMARRRTADGELVQVWSDGAITIGHEMSNRVVAKKVPRDVLWIIADDVSLYDASEVPALVKAARKALVQLPAGGAAAVRAAMRVNAPRQRPTADESEAIMATNERRRMDQAKERIVHRRAPGW